MHYIIIAGTRTFTDYSLVKQTLKEFLIEHNTAEKPVIISGMAKGADMLGYKLAQEYHLICKLFPALWDLYGKRAGHIRNQQMAKYAASKGRGVLFAFWDGISVGTKDMITLARKYNLEVKIINYKEGE